MTGQRCNLLSARNIGVHDVQGQVDGFLVGKGAFAAEPMRAAHFPVITGENDDGVVGQAQRVEFVEQKSNLLVHTADAVEIEVREAVPTLGLGGMVPSV